MNAVYEEAITAMPYSAVFPSCRCAQDVSAHRFEQRGVLHCEIDLQGRSIHCFCVHFVYSPRDGRAQMHDLIGLVQSEVRPMSL